MIQSIGGPAVLIFIGALISATGAIWAAKQQTSSEQILREKADEITSLNKHIANSITGGDSFAYIIPMFSEGNDRHVTMLMHKGEHTLYDLVIRVVDVDVFEKEIASGATYWDMQGKERILKIGNFSANSSSMLGPMKLGGSSARFNLFFNARNGFFNELLRIQKVDEEWKVAIKVYDSSPAPSKVLYEQIDEGFPLNKNGEVEW